MTLARQFNGDYGQGILRANAAAMHFNATTPIRTIALISSGALDISERFALHRRLHLEINVLFPRALPLEPEPSRTTQL